MLSLHAPVVCLHAPLACLVPGSLTGRSLGKACCSGGCSHRMSEEKSLECGNVHDLLESRAAMRRRLQQVFCYEVGVSLGIRFGGGEGEMNFCS